MTFSEWEEEWTLLARYVYKYEEFVIVTEAFWYGFCKFVQKFAKIAFQLVSEMFEFQKNFPLGDILCLDWKTLTNILLLQEKGNAILLTIN